MKLTHSGIKPTAIALWAGKGQKCALCKLPLPQQMIVLDHDHKSGLVRGAVHRRCNSLLGKLENNAPRFGFNAPGQLEAFMYGVGDYLRAPPTQYIHPLHKTEDEKRIARNLKAQKLRALKRTHA